jgi:hypothetical protein
MLINSALRRIWVTFQLSCLISVVGKELRRVFLKLFLMNGASFRQILTSRDDKSSQPAETSPKLLSFSKKSLAIFRLREVKKLQKEIILHVIESVV